MPNDFVKGQPSGFMCGICHQVLNWGDKACGYCTHPTSITPYPYQKPRQRVTVERVTERVTIEDGRVVSEERITERPGRSQGSQGKPEYTHDWLAGAWKKTSQYEKDQDRATTAALWMVGLFVLFGFLFVLFYHPH